MSLFKAALARLSGLNREGVDAAIDSGSADLLALACATVGIDAASSRPFTASSPT
jgi:hypothetical protein